MDGIINLHKPVGITSARALYRVRAITGQRKSGHAGTLDPAASGVLLLCLGRATKLVEQIMDQPKVYRTTARLDVTSESFDADRPLIPVAWAARRGLQSSPRGEGRCPSGGKTSGAGDLIANPTELDDAPPCAEVVDAIRHFEGEIEQVPPAISAVKIAGQPAYKRRAGEEPLDLKPRPVRIYWIHVHDYAWPTIDFEMCCGRGTYVRALIRDLGVRLGTGGCLTSLVRSRVGPLAIDDAWSIADIEKARDQGIGVENPPRPYLIPLDEALRLLSANRLLIPPRP